MQAVVFEQFGEPSEVLKVQSVPDPNASRGQVLVRMHASPVNPSDLMNIRGTYTLRPELPAIPGFEGVGIVESSGGGLLGRLMVGKRVAVLNRDRGNWCERTVVSARQVIPLPRSLSMEQSAMFFVNPATAFIMTREILAVPRGEWLVQTAAASALGRMIIRLGKHCGFRTVNIVRREEQAEQLRQLGGDAVTVFDPERNAPDELAERLQRETGNADIRYAIDPVAGETGSALVPCLGRHGRLLVFGTLSGQPLCFSSRQLMSQAASVEGFWLGNYMDGLSLPSKLRLIRRITALIQSGVLASDHQPVVPLESVREAVLMAEQTGRQGKILLGMGEH